MPDPISPVSDVQRYVLETIYAAFKETRDWPSFDHVERALDKRSGDDLNDILASLTGLYGSTQAGRGVVWHSPEEKLYLRVRGLAACRGAEEDIGLFVATVQWVVQLWWDRGDLPSPQAHEPIRRGAKDIVGLLGQELGRDPYAYQVELMLELMSNEPFMPSPGGPLDDRMLWEFAITRDVRRFKDVSSVESFLEVLPPEPSLPVSATGVFEQTSDKLRLDELAVSSRGDVATEADPQVVMVVYGRNTAARNAMFSFLRALGLRPIEWEQAVASTGQGSPHNLEAVQAAMRLAQAVVVVLTAEDQAGLIPELAGASDAEDIALRGQPRQNVILEAGMAMGVARERTILVELGPIRTTSDFEGLNTVRISNEAKKRDALRSRLQSAGCAVQPGSDWLEPAGAGDFDTAAIQWSPVSDWHVEPPPAATTTVEDLEERKKRPPKRGVNRETRRAQEEARIENIIERVLDMHAGNDQPLEVETFLRAIDNPKLEVVWANRMLAELEASGRVYRNPDGPGWYPVPRA